MSASTFILNDLPDDKHLPLNSNIQCNIAPMVIMSILNHYQRRPSNKRQNPTRGPAHKYPTFVIGLLFGHKLKKDKNSLIINDAFGLETQINPNNNQVALELSVAKEALKLHSMSNPNDRLVGWYRTGLEIEASSIAIHDKIVIETLSALSNKISKKAGMELDASEYIHLLVDTTLTNNTLSIKAYSTVPIIDPIQATEYSDYLKEKKRRERAQKNQKKNTKSRKKRRKKKDSSTVNASEDISPKKSENSEEKKEEIMSPKVLEPLTVVEKPTAVFCRFKQLICNYLASESERIGLEMIIESPPEGNTLDSPSLLMSDTAHLESVLQSLLQNLESVQNYVHRVQSGAVKGDESIGWLIGDALSSVPNLSPAKFEQMISNRLQDFLMMEYLGKMTKAQLVIADKINKVLPSTVPGFEQDNM